MTQILRCNYKNRTSIFYIFYIGVSSKIKKYLTQYQETGTFTYNRNKYLIFYVNEDIILDTNIEVYAFSYKIDDNYILNDKNSSIWKLITMQSIDRLQMPGNFSSVDFMEIASNKIQYFKFLLDMGVVESKKVLNPNKPDFKKYKNSIIKLPYSSTSACVFFNNVNIKKKNIKVDDCYSKEGFILEKFNHSPGEFKIVTLYGKIQYLIYFTKIKKKSVKIYLDNKFKCHNKQIETLVKPYIKDIEKLIKDVYHKINLLIEIKKQKIKKEEKYFEKLDIEDTKYKDLISSLFYSYKIKYLKILQKKGLPVKKLLNLVSQSFCEYYENNKTDFKNYPESDPYMRIDIKLPDNINYDKIMLVELDTYASGKSKDLVKSKNLDFGNKYYITHIMKKNYYHYREQAKHNILNKA